MLNTNFILYYKTIFNIYTFFYKTFFKRFFFKNNLIVNNTIKLKKYLYYYINLIFNDYTVFFTKNLIELNLLFIYLRNNYYTIRFFFGYPIKKRTRSNSKTAIKKSLLFKNIIIKYIYYNYFIKEKDSDKLMFLYIEFFNKLWFFQWYIEWYSAYVQLSKIINRKFLKWKFSYIFLTLHRPIVFINKNFKKKSNKKKQIELKNTYNIGFFFGFTLKYKDIIKKFNLNNQNKLKKK